MAADQKTAVTNTTDDKTVANFWATFDALRPSLVNMAANRLGDRNDAEDMVQEVGLKAENNLSSFRGDSSLETWLRQILRNRCADEWRKSSRRQCVPLDEFESDLPSHDISPLNAALAAEQADILSRAIDNLPERMKQIFVLKRDGFKAHEISVNLDITEITVRVQLHRARLKLYAALGVERPAAKNAGANKIPSAPNGLPSITDRKFSQPRRPIIRSDPKIIGKQGHAQSYTVEPQVA